MGSYYRRSFYDDSTSMSNNNMSNSMNNMSDNINSTTQLNTNVEVKTMVDDLRVANAGAEKERTAYVEVI